MGSLYFEFTRVSESDWSCFIFVVSLFGSYLATNFCFPFVTNLCHNIKFSIGWYLCCNSGIRFVLGAVYPSLPVFISFISNGADQSIQPGTLLIIISCPAEHWIKRSKIIPRTNSPTRCRHGCTVDNRKGTLVSKLTITLVYWLAR